MVFNQQNSSLPEMDHLVKITRKRHYSYLSFLESIFYIFDLGIDLSTLKIPLKNYQNNTMNGFSSQNPMKRIHTHVLSFIC